MVKQLRVPTNPATRPADFLETQAYRNGAANGIKGLPSRNPYGWSQPFKMLDYNNGYARGECLRKREATYLPATPRNTTQ